MRGDPFEGPQDAVWDWWGDREVLALGLETEFVGDVGHPDDLAVGGGVRELAVDGLGLGVGADVLQLALLFGRDSVSGFVAAHPVSVVADVHVLPQDRDRFVARQLGTAGECHAHEDENLQTKGRVKYRATWFTIIYLQRFS